MELERNDEHFEEVLGRLDSLIRRGQPETLLQPPPPPISQTSIPVLTEVYEASTEPVPSAPLLTDLISDQIITEVSVAEKLEQAVAAVLPTMVAVLEEALAMKVQPAMERALSQVLDDLHPQIESILRQQLKTLLAQESGNQTEM